MFRHTSSHEFYYEEKVSSLFSEQVLVRDSIFYKYIIHQNSLKVKHMTIYLYIKTHNKTGLKYFGKTTKKDPHKYTGSGTYWKRHLHKHGADYTTQIVSQFDDESLCEEFALKFSKEHDIVNSNEWANLQEENGITGAPKGHPGHKFTLEQLQNLSETTKQRWNDPQYRTKIKEAQIDSWTEQRRQQQGKRLTGKKRPDHSEKMKGRKLHETHPFFNDYKTEEHKQKIKEALTGIPKSEEHKNKLRVPKLRCCRLSDRKEVSVNALSRHSNLSAYKDRNC
jgi:hypothetical protein